MYDYDLANLLISSHWTREFIEITDEMSFTKNGYTLKIYRTSRDVDVYYNDHKLFSFLSFQFFINPILSFLIHTDASGDTPIIKLQNFKPIRIKF